MTLAEKTDTAELLPETFSRWFASRGWTPRAHQLELLSRARGGRSVLLIAPTGGGKTLAGFLPTLVELSERATGLRKLSSHTRSLSPRTPLAPSPLEGEGGGEGYNESVANEGAPPSRRAEPVIG